MKLFKSRKLSILLALALVLTSFSFTAMADTAVAEDLPIISAAKNLKDITNAQTGLPDEYKIVTDKECVDDTTGRTVVKYSATKYGAPSRDYDAPGSEPRSAMHTLLAKADYKNDRYDNLTIAFDIYIANPTDGVGFRMERFSAVTDADAKIEKDKLIEKVYHYVGVGGSEFTAGTAAHKYVNKDLKVGEWNKVVIELGANTTNKDVIFHVNGKSTVCATKLPENTYGFGGVNQNRAAFVPKGTRDMPFEIRLDNFSIKATNTRTDFYIFGSGSFTADKLTTRNKIEGNEVNALEFSESYNKKALNIRNTTTSGLSAGAGSEVGFPLTSGLGTTDQASLGGLDWSKYKNLRIQFNTYLGYENIVYFRTVRSTDGGATYDKGSNNHVIGIGTPADPNGKTSGTANTDSNANATYRNRNITPNMWHNVVMELGANKNNKYINVYIDGERIDFENNATEFTNADTAEGFGTVGPNRLLMVFRDTTDSLLDIQISDISFTACNSMYTPDAAPTITGVATKGLTYRVDTENKAITYVAGRDADGMSVADFKVSDVDYVAPTDATNTKVIAYNDSSKRVTYYTLAKQEAPVLDGVQAEIGEDGRLYVKFDYNNGGEEEVSFKLHTAYYKNNALEFLRADTWCKMPVGLSAASYDLSMPKSVDYDKIKVFLWASTGGENPVTVVPVMKMAEIEVVK